MTEEKGVALVQAVSGPAIVEDDGKRAETDSKKYKRPRNFEKLVSAAYVIGLAGHGGIALATRVTGLSRGTIDRARSRDDLWADAVQVAEERWLDNMTAISKRALAKALRKELRNGEGKLSGDFLRGRIKGMQPTSKVEVSAPGGGPIQLVIGAIPAGFTRADSGKDPE